jgi:hypothetical protein
MSNNTIQKEELILWAKRKKVLNIIKTALTAYELMMSHMTESAIYLPEGRLSGPVQQNEANRLRYQLIMTIIKTDYETLPELFVDIKDFAIGMHAGISSDLEMLIEKIKSTISDLNPTPFTSIPELIQLLKYPFENTHFKESVNINVLIPMVRTMLTNLIDQCHLLEKNRFLKKLDIKVKHKKFETPTSIFNLEDNNIYALGVKLDDDELNKIVYRNFNGLYMSSVVSPDSIAPKHIIIDTNKKLVELNFMHAYFAIIKTD